MARGALVPGAAREPLPSTPARAAAVITEPMDLTKMTHNVENGVYKNLIGAPPLRHMTCA